MTRFTTPIAAQIWDMKYRFKAADGTPLDGTVEDTWRRIARALAEVEAQPAVWETRFYAALEGFRFLPAGRITAGAGTGRSVTLFNCFVMGTIPDSMGGIFDEYSLFKDHAPNAKILPIMSTGGAAERLGAECGASAEFVDELDYVALFHRQLHIDPNELRSPQRGSKD